MPGAITFKYTGNIITYESGDQNVHWPTHSLRKRSGTVEEPVQVSVCLSRVCSTSDRRTNRLWSPPCGNSYRRDPGLHGPLTARRHHRPRRHRLGRLGHARGKQLAHRLWRQLRAGGAALRPRTELRWLRLPAHGRRPRRHRPHGGADFALDRDRRLGRAAARLRDIKGPTGGRGSNQGFTQNEKSPRHQNSIDFRCYLGMALLNHAVIVA